MKNITQLEADLLALEVVATAIAGVSYEATNSAIEYALANNLELDITSVSVGMASMLFNNNNPQYGNYQTHLKYPYGKNGCVYKRLRFR